MLRSHVEPAAAVPSRETLCEERPRMTNLIVDLRSDTVTKPTPEMRRAMAEAEVGDDVLGDDPTVIRLQERVAELLGKEAACFMPSGTMANQSAIRAQTEPGDEILAHPDSHIIHYETGAPAALSGCMIRPVPGERGQYSAADLERLIRDESVHSPRSRLVIVENTHNRGGGSVWPMERVTEVAGVARRAGLRLHLDGARLWNACAASGHEPRDYARHFDTVSTCFSKALGAPAGSTVSGDRATITRVHRIRKMLGGAMRQSGVLAAAALHALDHHRDRLPEDHANAKFIAEGLAQIKGLSVKPGEVETNIVYVGVDPSVGSAADYCARVRAAGVLVLPTAPQYFRVVLHLQAPRPLLERAIRVFAHCTERA